MQTYIVHLLRHSLSYCGGDDRDAVAAALKLIYRAENEVMALKGLEDFEASAWAGSIRPSPRAGVERGSR